VAACGGSADSTAEGIVRVWDLATGEPVGRPRTYNHPVHSVIYAPGGNRLLLAHAAGILETDAETGQVRASIHSSQAPEMRLAVNDIGYLAHPAPDSTVRVWSLQEGREAFVLRGHTNLVMAVAYSPDDKQLVTASLDGSVRIWDLTRPYCARVMDRPDGRYAGTPVPFAPRPTRYSGLAFDPTELDSRQGARKVTGLAAAPRRDDRPADQQHDWVSLLDPNTGKVILRVPGRNDAVFGAGGRWLAAGNADGGITLYDSATSGEIRRLGGRNDSPPLESRKDHYCHRIAVNRDGSRLVSGGLDGTIQVWNPDRGELICSWRAHSRTVECVAVSPDGALVVTAGSDGAYLWDATTGARVRSLGGPGAVRAVAFSSDGRVLATGGADRVIQIWDPSGKLVRALHGHILGVCSVAFSPDNQRLVSGSLDKTVRLWDVRSGQELLSLPGVANMVEKVVFSPDGSRIAVANLDIVVWEAATGK
jgi:eukaryotic-like serine/threonine-protein kinase